MTAVDPGPGQVMLARRITLLALAAFNLTRAAAYSPLVARDPQGAILEATLGGAVLPVWVALWTAAGLACLMSVPSTRLTPATTATVALMGGWGAMWLFGWIIDPATLWWQTFITYAAPAVAIAALTSLASPRVVVDP